MSVNDDRLASSLCEKMIRDEVIRAKAVKQSADARQEIIEAMQFERGYN